MATKITKIQVRRDTADNWRLANPTLSVGEIGFEQDTYRFKIGFENQDWITLPYFSGQGIVSNTLSEVLKQDNNGMGYDIHVDGLNLRAIKQDGKITEGGISGEFLPTDRFRTSKMVNGVFETTEYVTQKPSLGDNFNRFPSAYLEGTDGQGTNFLVFGREANISDLGGEGNGSLSYKSAPTEPSILTITSVDEAGRVTGVDFASLGGINNRGKGYYTFEGVPVQYTGTFDPNNPNSNNPGSGRGLRVDVTSVDANGQIDTFVVRDPGVGYQENETIIIALPGHIIAEYEGFQRRIVSPVATQEDLKHLTTQSIPVGAQSLIAIGTNISGSPQTRTLPDTDFIQNAEDFDLWTYRSLVQLEYLKPTVRDCVKNGPLLPNPQDPSDFNFLNPGANPIAVTNVAGVDVPDTDPRAAFFHQDWGLYVGGKQAFGGEILVYDPTLYTDPNDISGNAPVGAWTFAFRPRVEADLPLEEEDPIFMAHAAANIRGIDYTGSDFDGTPTTTVINHPHYKREPGQVEPLMMVNNWKAIGRL